jgi:hypothetical protein
VQKSSFSSLPKTDFLPGLMRRALGGLMVTVEAGAHKGARLVHHGDAVRIGSDLANDAVLIADGLAARHVRISEIDPWRSTILVAAEDEPVMAPLGKVLRNGQSRRLELPALVQAGQATIRIEMARRWQDLMPQGRRTYIAVGAVLALVVGMSAVSSLFRLADPSAYSSSFETARLPGTGGKSADAAREALRLELDKAGFGSEIRLEMNPSGSLVAAGTIDPSQAAKWRDILKWYDSRPNSPLLVNNVTRSAQMAEMPQLRSVWVDSSPSVVTSTGQTVRVGDTITGGWQIESINRNGVVLTKDGKSTRLTF